MKAVVVGSGAWGTALAIQLCKNGHDVTMWTFEKELIPQMENERHNIRLPHVSLPAELKISGDYACIRGAKLVVMAPPLACHFAGVIQHEHLSASLCPRSTKSMYISLL